MNTISGYFHEKQKEYKTKKRSCLLTTYTQQPEILLTAHSNKWGPLRGVGVSMSLVGVSDMLISSSSQFVPKSILFFTWIF